jgi:hypothetical protein
MRREGKNEMRRPVRPAILIYARYVSEAGCMHSISGHDVDG